MIVSVDNGISGGSVALKSDAGNIIGYRSQPTMQRAGKTEVDLSEWGSWVESFKCDPIIVLEEPLKHAKSSQAVRSMAMCFGGIMGYSLGKGWEFHAVTVKEWQTSMLGKFPKGGSKEAALRKAEYILPNESWVDPTKPRARRKHDGIIDAFLIGKYYPNRK